jgi:hypothetical protein
MIMTGQNLTSALDPLTKIKEEHLFYSLRNPNPAVDAKIRQLRVVYSLDQRQYAVQKRTLPYFVCGIFDPPYRKTDNFAFTENFIIDIDKLTAKGLSLSEVRKRIQADQRVLMCFTSPSQDGLKVMFQFKERCYDAGIYSIFYKLFLQQFSMKYNLEQVVDSRTSDVARACFISVDADAFYNPFCEPVDINAYIDSSNPAELFSAKEKMDRLAKVADTDQKLDNQELHTPDPEADIMNKIKKCLNPNAKTPKTKNPAFIPEQLEEIMADLTKYINDTGLVVKEIINIQYAKKIRVSMGLKQAEINLFFGKRGFSVVKSPRCGTDKELNDVVAELIQTFIDTR